MRTRCHLLLAPFFVLASLLALVATVLTPAPALAATKIWNGVAGGDANWTTPGNWIPVGAPAVGDDLVFPEGASLLTNNDFPPNRSFHSILVEASGYTLSGNALTIAASQSITANYSGTSTINLPVSGNGTSINVVQTGSMLVFGGSLTNQNTSRSCRIPARALQEGRWEVRG
jgi:hypothetical protein